MLKKFVVSVVVVCCAIISCGMAYAQENPLVGKYLWRNLYFGTEVEMEITENKFFTLDYTLNRIEDEVVYLTVYELGNTPIEFKIVRENNGRLLKVNRRGLDGRLLEIAEAQRR